MSVAGFDIGNDTSCIAIARKRGIDVLLNKESKRETPAVVNFGEKMRFLGTDGSAKQGLSPQNTVAELKRLIGRKFSDPIVQADLARHPFKVSEGPDGGCLITVMFQNEQQTFTPEQVMAMILVDLKKISEAETGVPPVDCVVTVPVYFNEAQRYAMINAAQIAGLNVLRLMNENTATALAYGIFKTDLPETEPVHVAFVDVGHSATQVSIVSLRKGGLQVKAHTWDDSLGGRDFDELLFEHFAAEFKAKNKIDIKSNKKASFKLRTSCEKVKKMLSANAEAPLNIECIMEDTDVRGMMDRERFEALGETHSARFKGVLEKAIAQSGLTTEQISSVEVVGSSVRIPMLARLVESVFGKIASRTLNAKECVSRGAALQCAMLSPVFKVREFEVIDACPYNIDFVWDKDGKTTSQRLFERGSPFPAAKMLTFLRAQPFNITAVCADTGETLGQYAVGPFTPPAGSDVAKLKVKVRMNMHGLVSVESVQAIEEEEEAAPAAAAPAAADTPMADAAAAGPQPEAAAAADGAAPAANGDQPAPMETDAAAAAAAAAPAAADAAAAAKKRKVKRSDVPFAVSGVAGYDQKQLDLYFEKEAQMQAADHLQEETADRKNAVEAYLYKLRNALYGPLEAFVREAEKEAVLAKLQATEDWLYEEGEDCTKSVYVAKLEELKTMGGPIEQRAAEQEARPAAAAALRSAAEGYLSWAASTEPRFSHITPEERQPVANEAKAALDWLSEKQALQAQLSKADPPVLLAADCNKKCEVLERLARPIVNKPPPPKPAPASPPKPADAAAAQAPQQEAAAGAEPAAAAAAAGAEGGAAPMDSEGGSEGIPPLEPMQP